MAHDNYHDDEASEAQDRIDRIRRGGKPQVDDSFDNERVVESRSRIQRVRETLEEAESGASRGRSAQPGEQPSAGISPAYLFVAGLLGIIALLIVILLIASASSGNPILPSLFQPAETETPTPTITPSPAPTETPSPSPTVDIPRNLGLPPLECLYSGPGCYDFCQDPSNRVECDSAREFLSRQRIDPDTWFNCVAPGPGANVGNPQKCLEEAWRAANP
jgi:hypothetical protein